MLKPGRADVEVTYMSDLTNLLGDLYGDTSNPDGPPVRREAPAFDRTRGSRGDDDLATALSAALAEPPTPVAPAPAPVVHTASQPVEAQVSSSPRGAWTAPPAQHAEPVYTSSPVATVTSGGWSVGDDDIVPMAGAARKRR